MFTLCSLVFNNSDYLFFQEKICRRLALYDYKRLILDSSENPDERKKLKKLNNSKIIDAAWVNNYSGSTAHGAAVNEMFRHVDTKYAIILDLDIVPLVKEWDKIILQELMNGCDAIGVPYNPLHGFRRIQNMPTVFFLAFEVEKLRGAKLDWRTLPTPLRLNIYWLYRIFYNKILKKEGYPKYFDFEMSQWALLKMKLKRFRTVAFNMVQPWDPAAKLKFDISDLPLDKTKVDPLVHSYPEEWHFNGKPFVSHQRRSYAKSFYNTPYSKNWVDTVNNYLQKEFSTII